MIEFCILNAALASLVPSEQSLREMIKYDGKYWPRDREDYLAYGPLAYPAYRAILDDKKSTDMEVYVVITVLCGTKFDIQFFNRQLIGVMASEHANFRAIATDLFGRHATAADAPQFTILLFDPDRYVIFGAAGVLSKVGDRNALTAMELWQYSKSNTANPGQRAIVKDYENALRMRLDKEEAERKKADPPKK